MTGGPATHGAATRGLAKQQLARHGEQLAVDYLTSEGMKILDRNWRCRHGEIDIIAEDGPALVVVEVKTRSGRSHGTALESVRPAKLSRLRMLAAQWLTGQPRTFQTVRVDVIALERFAGDYSLRHVRGAI
ncbi:YraN family protein [Nonomuraea sp. RK-328]|nr:YraN family protein [Nonomuraea sp. RK-328]